ADAELFADGPVHAALVEVRTGLVVCRQLLLVKAAGRVERIEHRVDVAVAVALAGLARHLHAGGAGQLLDRAEEFQPVELHQKADRAAVRAAADAVAELLGRRDGERTRALVMERPAGRVFPSLALERHP